MFSGQQILFFAGLVFLATTSYQVQAVDLMLNETDDFYNETMMDDFYNETMMDDFYNETMMDDFYNETEIDELTENDMDIDCTCDDSGISCSVPADEEECACEDGDVICVDVYLTSFSDMGKIVVSGAYSTGSVAMAIVAVGAAAVAM